MIIMLWLKKYEPKSLSEFLGIEYEINEAKCWLETFKNEYVENPILLIIGPPSTGKTVFSKLFISEEKYYSFNYENLEFKNNKNIENDIKKLLKSVNIYSMFCKKTDYMNKILLLDNLDYLMMSDKTNISKLINAIKSMKKKKLGYNINTPIIFISSGTNERKLNDIKKLAKIIYFKEKKNSQIYQILNNIIKKEKIKINKEGLETIIDNSHNNIRISILYLQELYIQQKTLSKQIKSKNILKNYIAKNIIERNLFESIHKLFKKYNSINENISIYDNDRCLVPMMIYQNYLRYVNLLNCSSYQQLKSQTKIISSIIESDLIDNQIHNYQLWYLQKYNGINYSCLSSYEINKYPHSNNQINIQFTELLSKSALHYFNYTTNLYLKNKLDIDHDNLVYMINLILYYIFQIDQKKGLMYLKNNNLDFIDIDKLIKLSKIGSNYDYKDIYTSSFKNKLKLIYEEI